MNVSEKEMTRLKEKRARQDRLSSSEGENAVSVVNHHGEASSFVANQ